MKSMQAPTPRTRRIASSYDKYSTQGTCSTGSQAYTSPHFGQRAVRGVVVEVEAHEESYEETIDRHRELPDTLWIKESATIRHPMP
jgi:hypothetical protein